MVLDIGELVGRLRVDPDGMDRGLQQGEGRFRQFGNRLTGLAAGLGIAAGGALFAGLLASMDQSNVGAKIAAQLGQGAEEAAAYGKLAGKLYAENWGESAAQIGDTIKQVVQEGLVKPGDSAGLENVTRQAQILSDVFGTDVNASVSAVAQLIKNGLVKDSTEGFDLIAKGIQGGLNQSEDLNETIQEYSTQFRELGLSGADAFGLMQQAIKAGARDTDTAADALKEFAIRSRDGSKTSAEGFKALGLDAAKMTKQFAAGGEGAKQGLDIVLDKLRLIKDPAERDAAAVALFGTKAEDLGDALFSMNLDGVSGQFDNVAGTVAKAGETMGQTDSAKLQGFKRQIEGVATSLAADLVPSLSSAGEWIKKNQEWIKPLVTVLGGLAVAIVAVNLATRAWAAATAAWTAVQGAATAVQWLFNAALLASPITWIVLGILLLIGVIILIATKTTWFQDLWKWAWTGIKAAAMAVWSWIKDTMWPWLQGMYQAHVAAVVSMKNGIVSAWNAVMSFFASSREFFRGVFSAIGDFIAGGFNKGKEAARLAVNSIIGFVNGAIGGLNSLIGAANKIPGVNIGTIGSIPKLASGGVVHPSPGGTPVIMGDGGQVEYGVPEDKLLGMLRRAQGGAGGGSTTLRIIADVNGMFRVIRDEVRAKGGSVQTVLG